MACFLVPMAIAIITSVVQAASRSLAEKLKLWILNTLLWGGTVLLALEHMWHGEVVPWPPFLTAMLSPADIPVMLHEMATIGTAISAATFAVWGTILTISHYMTRAAALRALDTLKKTSAP